MVLVVLVPGSVVMIPVMILSAVVGFVTAELLPPGRAVPPVGRSVAPRRPTRRHLGRQP
ncbi:hypothetical protein ACH4UM_31265 [Streptomyces sp. NPDC020801]|uniref:hypothetical protein n=1 Tax=unclassified Streptomyces TaxID=2593676 RepID=UPI00379464C2